MVECAKYFLSRVETVMDPDYEPVDNDIVQARVKTEGIIEHEFEISSRRGEMKKKLILVRSNSNHNMRHSKSKEEEFHSFTRSLFKVSHLNVF